MREVLTGHKIALTLIMTLSWAIGSVMAFLFIGLFMLS